MSLHRLMCLTPSPPLLALFWEVITWLCFTSHLGFLSAAICNQLQALPSRIMSKLPGLHCHDGLFLETMS